MTRPDACHSAIATFGSSARAGGQCWNCSYIDDTRVIPADIYRASRSTFDSCGRTFRSERKFRDDVLVAQLRPAFHVFREKPVETVAKQLNRCWSISSANPHWKKRLARCDVVRDQRYCLADAPATAPTSHRGVFTTFDSWFPPEPVAHPLTGVVLIWTAHFYARQSIATKLEDITKTTAGSLSSGPRFA